jgi:uncharacterized protein (DUF2164 family)
MGDVYLIRRGWRDPKVPVESMVVGSEYLDPEEVLRFVNGNLGIFFYERDLWYPKRLKKKLLKIVEAIDKLDIPPMMKP